MANPLDELAERLRKFRTAFESLPVPPGLRQALPVRDLAEPTRNLLRRLDAPANAPVRVVFFGPTGAGKSKLFNSLVGEVVSPSGYRRPYTRQAVYHVHRDHRDALADVEELGVIHPHDEDSWRDRVLIDTPDFDSVEELNHEIAERVYFQADVFIFVTDVHKYADAATWECCDRLRREAKPTIFVINKVKDALPANDFRERLREAFGAAAAPEVVAVPFHSIPDAELLPADDAALGELASRLRELLAGTRNFKSASFELDLKRWADGAEAVLEPIDAHVGRAGEIADRLRLAFEKHRQSLQKRLHGDVDPGLKEELYQEMLARLEKLDVLRYPRKLIALPVQGARRFLGRYIPAIGPSQPTAADDVTAGRPDPNLPAVEAAVVDFQQDALGAFGDAQRDPAFVSGEPLTALRLSHEEFRRAYDERLTRYRAWAAETASDMASQLTGSHKAKFLLSQVLYNGVMISIQVQSGGVFTFAELLTDGVLSPLVARAVGMGISSGQVTEFEAAASRKHFELMVEILEEARDRFASHLDEVLPRGLEVTELLEEASRVRQEIPELSRHYAERLASGVGASETEGGDGGA